MGSGIRLDFSNGENSRKHTELFTETGLWGTLEAKDNENIDLASPLSGGIVDACSVSSGSASITDVFTQYMDLIQTTRKQSDRPDLTDHKILDLQRQIDFL